MHNSIIYLSYIVIIVFYGSYNWYGFRLTYYVQMVPYLTVGILYVYTLSLHEVCKILVDLLYRCLKHIFYNLTYLHSTFAWNCRINHCNCSSSYKLIVLRHNLNNLYDPLYDYFWINFWLFGIKEYRIIKLFIYKYKGTLSI